MALRCEECRTVHITGPRINGSGWPHEIGIAESNGCGIAKRSEHIMFTCKHRVDDIIAN